MNVIIGAGAAGLAMARELKQRGLPHHVLEQGAIGDTWSRHYERLRLHTLKSVSALPGLPMPDDYPDFPSVRQVQAYLQRYAWHHALSVSTGVRVHHAAWRSEAWHLTTSAGRIEADTLTVASGIWRTPVWPKINGLKGFRGRLLHASAYRNPADFAGQRVLVIGAGNSGCEIAAELGHAGVDTNLSVRGGVAFIPRPVSDALAGPRAQLLRTAAPALAGVLYRQKWADVRDLGLLWPDGDPLVAYPVVGFDLPDAVRAGRVSLRGAVAQIAEHAVVFADGSQQAYDAVLCATGYRPTLDFLEPGHVMLDARGTPEVDAGQRSRANPRLVCLGFAYPTTEGWLQSIGRFAAAAAEGVALHSHLRRTMTMTALTPG
jgi:cation diffusion facilitator CzcD-associated flavoprotein CzcO